MINPAQSPCQVAGAAESLAGCERGTLTREDSRGTPARGGNEPTAPLGQRKGVHGVGQWVT